MTLTSPELGLWPPTNRWILDPTIWLILRHIRLQTISFPQFEYARWYKKARFFLTDFAIFPFVSPLQRLRRLPPPSPASACGWFLPCWWRRRGRTPGSSASSTRRGYWARWWATNIIWDSEKKPAKGHAGYKALFSSNNQQCVRQLQQIESKSSNPSHLQKSLISFYCV